MSDHCPHCDPLRDVIRDAEDANAEQRDQIIALTRALTDARRGETNAKTKLSKQHQEAEDAKAIRACLDVWEECCWAGKKKPSVDGDDRAGLVRTALTWAHIDQEDICDAFRGLGLLPYRNKYNERSATPKPGFKRATDIVEALREASRLERFRDYYHRLQSSPADRLREQWEQSAAVTDLLFVELLRTRAREEREQVQEQGRQHGHLFVIEGKAA